MQEGTSTPETIVDTLEKLKNEQDELIGLWKDIKQIMLELTELDEEEWFFRWQTGRIKL